MWSGTAPKAYQMKAASPAQRAELLMSRAMLDTLTYMETDFIPLLGYPEFSLINIPLDLRIEAHKALSRNFISAIIHVLFHQTKPLQVVPSPLSLILNHGP